MNLRLLKRIGLLTGLALFLAIIAFAQGETPKPEVLDDETVDAGFKAISMAFAALVWFGAFLVAKWRPYLKERYPAGFMVAVMAAPAALAAAGAAVSGFLGNPVSFDLILEALKGGGEIGAAAVAMHVVGKNVQKQRREAKRAA